MDSDSHGNKRKQSIGFLYAWNGLLEVIKTERNFQIHVIAAIAVVILGFYVQLVMMEWIIVIFVIGFVFVAEMMNTAIEKLIDYFKPEIHPSAKLIKDIAAGFVLIAALTAVIIGLIIFLPKLYDIFIT